MEGLRRLPKVDALAGLLGEELPWVYRVEAARRTVERARSMLREGRPISGEALVAQAREEAALLARPGLRRVINASGVVLHTGLGRARWAKAAAEAAAEAGANHAALEIRLDSGGRGDRQEHVEQHLRALVGCEAAMVVNNCAAAMVLILAALARGREVLLSRGQMVEIGGSFRMPEVIEASGCVLREVGCTNKTRIADYERALHEGVAAILRCHPSNFAVIGYVEEADPRELRALADRRGVLLVDDMGSGCLADLSRLGLPRVETMRDVASWAHVAAASGDKLLGGPQAGLIFGSRACLEEIRRYPLARALRPDKGTLAALEATLRLYREGRELEIPTLKYLARGERELRRMASRLARRIGPAARTVPSTSEVGGGALPGVSLATWAVEVSTGDPQAAARSLRLGDPPVLARVQEGKVLLDPRTMEEDEVGIAAARVREVVAREGAHG
ncbi:MAG: L-seryl-tRNA(Sec) selenium transferase [Fimbriimonadales bacterium]|nr:L-seryl-tRNA(Sec) selenium transferase [Fimbriimonadales bacterium]